VSLEGSIFIFARSQFDWSIIIFVGYIGQFQNKIKGKLLFCAPSQVVTIPTLGKTSKIKCDGVGCMLRTLSLGNRRKKENQGCVTFFWFNPQIELKLFYNSPLVTSTNYHLGGWQLIGFTPFSLSKTKSTKISLATSRQMKKIDILACFLPCFIGCQDFLKFWNGVYPPFLLTLIPHSVSVDVNLY